MALKKKKKNVKKIRIIGKKNKSSAFGRLPQLYFTVKKMELKIVTENVSTTQSALDEKKPLKGLKKKNYYRNWLFWW